MWYILKVIKISVFLIIFSSCTNPYRKQAKDALLLANSNRTELEKVLLHYEDDPDILKRQSACFLIGNMPYHAGFSSDQVEPYDRAYLEMAENCLKQRDSIYRSLTERLGGRFVDIYADITTMKADYLIDAIDDACKTWHDAGWSKEYDDVIFMDYVLPYRILDEPLSEWRKFIDNNMPILKRAIVQSNRGYEIEAENGTFRLDLLSNATSASQGKMVMLAKDGDAVTLHIEMPQAARKNIVLRYTSCVRGASCALKLNNSKTQALSLEPTINEGTFRENRLGIELSLKKGTNTLTISHDSCSVGVDKIRIRSVEPYDQQAVPDFSDFYCRIGNKATHEYITFDTLRSALLKSIELKALSFQDSLQLLRLNYLGYPCWNICVYKKDSTDLCMEAQYALADTAVTMTQYHYQGGNHQKWVIMPAGDKQQYFRIMNKNSGLFLEARKSLTSKKDTLVQMSYTASDNQLWIIDKTGRKPFSETFFQIGSAISEALRITDMMSVFEFLNYNGNIPPKATSLLKGLTGKCRDEANFAVYLSRYLGIPATVDFTPHWGNRSLSHSWSVLIKPDGSGTPFYMGCAPGDTAQYFHSYLKPKVFRHRFALNEQISRDMAAETSVPSLFDMPCFTDVTNEYYETTDVTREIPQGNPGHKLAYICVFDNRHWVPVFYGKIREGRVTFRSMGRRIMYMAAFYEQGRIVPFGNPFYITSDGAVHDVNAEKERTQTMHLLRKYPFMGKEDFFNLRMDRGRFEGSNDKDFADATVFHTHSGATNGNWYDIPIQDGASYKYLRYIGANGSHCNINELEFYDENDLKIQGQIIGTEGEGWCPKERVFDGDILTGFGGITPDGHWVGLRLKRPSRVSRIRYIGRNDGNGIEKGDKYELYYWNEGFWQRLATIVAEQNHLTLRNMPVGGLYVLRNLTKGHEERIFTYENGEQVWW